MQLQVAVPVAADIEPDDPEVLGLVEATISQQATAWTPPVYQGETTSDVGTRQFVYLTDAQPRTGIVTTANVAPALQPTKLV